MKQLFSYNKITPGTTLRVYCPSKRVYHYGIATYNNRVIDRAPRRGIAMRSLSEFSEGQPVEIVKPESGDFSLDQTHRIALQYIGNPHYNMISANCEQFVNFCRKGVSESKQVRKAGELFAFAALVVGALSLLGAESRNSKA